MSVDTVVFGVLPDGRETHLITLKNEYGTSVSILDYGAHIQAFVFDGKDILLGYDTVDGYVHNNGSYIGATIGRVCNRTADGRISLNGQEYQLACNETEKHGHLHGGKEGFDKKLWSILALEAGSDPSVTLGYISPDGEENYPGRLDVTVRYTLKADNTLELVHEAVADSDTYVNMTNHSYFNLNGYDGGDVLDTMLMVNAEEYTPVNDVFIPTGELAPVSGTALDLRVEQAIGDVVSANDPQVILAGGIDHNFVLSHQAREWHLAARAEQPRTNIRLDCYTDLPGIQVYSGNFLSENNGKSGHCWQKHDGFCLETQYFPNSANQPNFPSILLRSGETYRGCTQYCVSHIVE